jgi:dihydroneopterin aldolase/2-amino-4-hydroxy-6-hydroxymethyldihydropteridine diphosphokinase/dihydropteroate synthase
MIDDNIGFVSRLSYDVLNVSTRVGDRVSHLHRAIAELNRTAGTVVKTSLLYASAPQYVTDQPEFLNAVLELTTKLSPVELLEVIMRR